MRRTNRVENAMEMNSLILDDQNGTKFSFFGEQVNIKVFGEDTDAKYSLMHWTAAPGGPVVPHVHDDYEETFYVLDGQLEFVLGTEVFEVGPGGFVRVPPATRHGFRNTCDQPVSMLVSFSPGGMESLFLKYRDDADLPLEAYLDEAREKHRTVYEI